MHILAAIDELWAIFPSKLDSAYFGDELSAKLYTFNMRNTRIIYWLNEYSTKECRAFSAAIYKATKV